MGADPARLESLLRHARAPARTRATEHAYVASQDHRLPIKDALHSAQRDNRYPIGGLFLAAALVIEWHAPAIFCKDVVGFGILHITYDSRSRLRERGCTAGRRGDSRGHGGSTGCSDCSRERRHQERHRHCGSRSRRRQNRRPCSHWRRRHTGRTCGSRRRHRSSGSRLSRSTHGRQRPHCCSW